VQCAEADTAIIHTCRFYVMNGAPCIRSASPQAFSSSTTGMRGAPGDEARHARYARV